MEQTVPGPYDAQVCIVGAGSSGITMAQVLTARGVAFDCFEAGSGVGGNWRYDNDNEMSSAYSIICREVLMCSDSYAEDISLSLP